MEFFESTGNWGIALGKTLLYSLWIGLLLLSILKIWLQHSAIATSGIKYKLAVATLLFYTVTVVSLFFLLSTPDVTPPHTLAGTFSLKEFSEFQEPGMFSIKVIYITCSYLYFFGILVVLIRWIFSFRHVRRLKRSGKRVKGAWIERLPLFCKDLGIRINVELLESERVSVPSLFGLLKPVIIVPAGMLSSLPFHQVETILMHELYHLRRLDFLVNIFQIIAEGLFFYNPAVKAISKLIRTERENCCDDLVLEHCGRPLDYARALFELAKYHNSAAVLYPSAIGTDHHQLFNRIKRILNQSNMKSNIRERLSTLFLLAGGLVLLFSLTGFSQSFSKVQHDFLEPEAEQTANMDISGLAGPSFSAERMNQAITPFRVNDTVPGVNEKPSEMESPMETDQEEFENEVESARREAIEEIDWDKIKRAMKEAKEAALEEIDWEALHEELGQTKFYMDSILKEIDIDVDLDLDFEELRMEMEDAMMELKEIDWDEIRLDIEKSVAELRTIDIEEIRKEVEKLIETVE